MNMRQIVVFTDLDGTLIDHDTYEFKEAETALGTLRQRSIPVIICSSKTRAEIEFYRRRMNLDSPFIVENGGAIFIPGGTLDPKGEGFATKGSYRVIELGKPYAWLCNTWKEIKAKEKLRMTGFCEMKTEEIVAYTDLPPQEARLAAMREYSEPFVFHDTAGRFEIFERLMQQRGLQITKGGRFFHVTGRNDKGKAVRILTKVFAQTYPNRKLVTVGLGDSTNDVPMLKHVDIPVVIRKKSGEWEPMEGIDSLVYSQAPGPEGWAEAINRILP
jgi:mannosyl-3-phosphoglycerate phosphatase